MAIGDMIVFVIMGIKELNALKTFTLAGLIFIRPFVSGLAYPVFEFWYEIAVISTAITTIRHRVSPSSYAKASEDRLATHGVGYGNARIEKTS